jgi:hypothetical protein
MVTATMIRAAKFADIPALSTMMLEMHAASKYAGVVDVDVQHARGMLMAMIQRHGGKHDGGTLVNVAINADGEIGGFMIGLLDRVYHIGAKLAAKDAFLYVRQQKAAGALTVSRLIDAYLAWATSNPKVHEINLSWTDTVPGAERIDALYVSKGFTRCGAIYERGAR